MKEKLQAVLNKLQTILDKLPALIETGKKQQKIDAWDSYQKGGGRKDYNTAFSGVTWNQATFTPRHNIQPKSADYMFYAHNNARTGEDAAEAYDLAEHLEALGVTLDFSKATSVAHCFRHARITHVGTVDLSSIWGGGLEPTGIITREDGTQVEHHKIMGVETWYNCFSESCIEVIDKIIMPKSMAPAFGKQFFPSTLVEIGDIQGCIVWPLYLAHCPNVSHDTLTLIISKLADVKRYDCWLYHGGDPAWNIYKLHLGDTNLAKLTAEEIAVATGKGWIVLGDAATEEGDATEDTVDTPVPETEAAIAETETEEGLSV